METRRGKSPQQPMQPMGGAASTRQGKAAQTDKVELFLASIAESNPDLSASWGVVFEQVPMAVLASTEFWGHYATWLVEGYVIADGDVNQGQHLHVGPAQAAWSGSIDSARKLAAKYHGADATQCKVCA